jgi:uncharacterized protein (TIGR00725 family)
LLVEGWSTRKPLVAVIGDGSVDPGSPKSRLAERAGQLLVESGFRVLTGGLGGVMEAAARGARSARDYTPGDTVGILPGHRAGDASPLVDIAIPTGLLHGRILIVAHADAVLAIGGGAGTLSELAFAWIHDRLIVALRVDGWSGRLAGSRIDERVRFAAIPDDCVFPADTAEQAVAVLRGRLSAYNS